MNPHDLLEDLRAAAAPLSDLDAPAAPGVYALFLDGDAEVPSIAQPGDGPVYVGISSNLAQREFNTHFAAGQSGFSTLRHSLGALMLEELELKPQPRGAGTSDSNYRCYRFDNAGEDRLSRWMETNLQIGVRPVTEPKAIEKALIALACPPLNLTHWKNPDAPTVKAARRKCTDIARAANHR